MGLGVSYQLRVNPIACTAHGLCAELLPEVIELDPWGYPILLSPAVPDDVMDHARRAVDACPTLALLMEEVVDRLCGRVGYADAGGHGPGRVSPDSA